MELLITARQGERKSVACVPYRTGRFELPKEGIFAKNYALGPDYGFSLGYVSIDADGERIYFGFAESVVLVNGKAKATIPLKTQPIEIEFELKE